MPQLAFTGCCLAFLLGLCLDFPGSSAQDSCEQASPRGWAHTTSWFCSVQVIGLQRIAGLSLPLVAFLVALAELLPHRVTSGHRLQRVGIMRPGKGVQALTPFKGPLPGLQDSAMVL